MTVVGTRVLVTGAEGFIGSHVVEALVVEGADVRGFTWYDPNGRHGRPTRARPKCATRSSCGRATCATGPTSPTWSVAATSCCTSRARSRSHTRTEPRGVRRHQRDGDAERPRGVRRPRDAPPRADVDERGVRHPRHCADRGRPPAKAQSPYSAPRSRRTSCARRTPAGSACRCDPPTVQHVWPTAVDPGRDPHHPRPTPRRPHRAPAREPHAADATSTFVTDTARVPSCSPRTPTSNPGRSSSSARVSWSRWARSSTRASRLLNVTATVVEERQRVRPDASEVHVLLSDPSLAASLSGWKPEVDFGAGLAATAELAARARRHRPGRRLRLVGQHRQPQRRALTTSSSTKSWSGPTVRVRIWTSSRVRPLASTRSGDV